MLERKKIEKNEKENKMTHSTIEKKNREKKQFSMQKQVKYKERCFYIGQWLYFCTKGVFKH